MRLTDYFRKDFDLKKHIDIINCAFAPGASWIKIQYNQVILIQLAERHYKEFKKLIDEHNIIYLCDTYYDDPTMCDLYDRLRFLNLFCSQANYNFQNSQVFGADQFNSDMLDLRLQMAHKFLIETPWEANWELPKYVDMQILEKVQSTQRGVLIPAFNILKLCTKMDPKTHIQLNEIADIGLKVADLYQMKFQRKLDRRNILIRTLFRFLFTAKTFGYLENVEKYDEFLA